MVHQTCYTSELVVFKGSNYIIRSAKTKNINFQNKTKLYFDLSTGPFHPIQASQIFHGERERDC